MIIQQETKDKAFNNLIFLMNNLFTIKKRINKRLEEMLDPNNFRIEELGCMYILYFHSVMCIRVWMIFI